MNEGCRQGGGAITVEAEVILHAVNPDLVTPPEKDGSLCPGFVQGFLKGTQDFSPPAVFEKEYLLDGRPMENNHVDHQQGNGSCIKRADKFPLSNDKGTSDLSSYADSAVTNHIASMQQNCTSKDIPNGARAKVSSSADSSICSPSQAKQETDWSVLDSNLVRRDSSQENTQAKKEPDLVIEVGGQKINAHKSILAEKSDYFKARLSRDILKVKGVSYKTLSTLIDYIYTSRMIVSKDNVVDVITGAKILQIPCAVQAAMDSMSAQVTPENCYEILTIAKKQRLSELKETAYGFMSDNFLQVLKDPAVYGRLNGSERDLILKKRMEGRMTLMVAEINDVFDRVGSRPPSRCGSRPQSPLSVGSLEEGHMIYYFNETANDWRALTAMPEDINTKGCGICTMYNYLFVAGGIKGYGDKGKVSDKVFCYNPITNRWAEVKPLIQARAQLKLVSMDGYLYAIGGECLFTVEKYDPRMDRWTTVAPLPKGAFAVAHEATTCSGELYVSGGSLFYRLLKYDTKRDEWQECPYNNSRKKSSDMVALKSFIYRFDVNREQGINVFKYNTIVKMWHDCASQRLGSHLPFRCAVIGNCIYCVNKSQTLQFVVEEQNAYFVEEPLRAPLEAKGVLFPFVLTLPEKPDRVT
ncbi:kelch repeat and BTB domain-containing protein 11 [Notolabrus celidotus]|uniref:kelch repeat and BTB domain-containing protein 11 n=1 Tax=Notolabrus celidotus TaxID=1203425 RepID=UPI0014904F31|nr:kelch repeat and BTB domain-containing protein 11 [Notolabrus celidotus]XP_034530270.1 kelch repeat and BTB domain-containing protein 11 [Notolabrus celidotus]